MPGDMSTAASYAAATENLRAATRWLLTAAAGTGAVLVAGVQLTSIGSLGPGNWPRLAAAAGGLAAGLGAVGYMIFQASLLLTDKWITLAALELEDVKQLLWNPGRRRDRRRLEELRRIKDELQNYQDEFYGSVASSIPDLYSRLIEANRKARESPSAEHAETAAGLRKAVDTLVQAANYSYTRSGFAALRRRLALAGAVFIAGIVIFTYAANPPQPAAAGTATPAATAPKTAPPSTPPGSGLRRPSPGRLRLEAPDEPRSPRKRRSGVQDIQHVKTLAGHPAALFPPQPPQLLSRHGPVNRYVRVKAERSCPVGHILGPACAVTGPHISVEPGLLAGIRPVHQLRPQRLGELFALRLRQAQENPDRRWPEHYLIPGTHPAPHGPALLPYGGKEYDLKLLITIINNHYIACRHISHISVKNSG
jgi:hypothetical protein